VKVASFHVRASAEQAARWNRAAEAEGHRSAGTWLAYAADAYLKVRAKAGLPLPLAWRRFGRFEVYLDSGKATLCGPISSPFAAFRGDSEGPDRRSRRYSLVYLPEARIVATLANGRQAKALAAELAVVLIRGDPLPSLGAVVERHEREAK
jgi:hypothetical protein